MLVGRHGEGACNRKHILFHCEGLCARVLGVSTEIGFAPLGHKSVYLHVYLLDPFLPCVTVQPQRLSN